MQLVYAMIDLCIADGAHKINLLQHIPKLERPGFGIDLITLSRFKSLMVAFFRFLKLAKDLFQAFFPDSFFGFGRNANRAVLPVFVDIPFVS